MANFQKRTNSKGIVTYRAQVRLRGFPPETATFSRLTDAKRWAQQIEADIRAGRHVTAADAPRYTVQEAIDRYKEEVLPTKPASIDAQGPQLTWWAEQLGTLELKEVTPARLSEAKMKLAKTPTRQGKKRSNGSVNRYLAALSHVFTVAVKEWHWMDANPMRQVSKTKEPRGRVRFLSDDERGRLLEACRAVSLDALYPIVMLAIYTGMRQGEIRGLKWTDIDFDRARVVLEKTKNGERRQVPIARPSLEALKQWEATHRTASRLVFPGPKSKRKPVDLREAWKSAAAAAGLVDFHFHDTRHTAASYLAMSGASLAEIAEILGHKTLSMVKRYAHLTVSHTAGVVERMAEKFSPTVPNEKETPATSRLKPLSASDQKPNPAARHAKRNDPASRKPAGPSHTRKTPGPSSRKATTSTSKKSTSTPTR